MWNFESAEFGTALRRHGRSLVELRLETWQYYYDDWERDMSRAFGSLARIPLRRLEIELHELVPGYKNLANDEIEEYLDRDWIFSAQLLQQAASDGKLGDD
ncbi:unnamed protein product, partial [Clonostachys rosea f. rosea IK726]